jgi:hypothetical protein
MALETGVTYIEDLVDTNPVGATDYVDEGDDHIRNIKTAVQGSFPSLGATAVTSTAAELNILDGVTATTAEINIVDGDSADSSVTIADTDQLIINDAGTMKQTAFSDLVAYIKSEITGGLNQKVLSIGTWNMNSTASVNVAHGITLSKLRAIVNVLIISDTGTYYSMEGLAGGGYTTAQLITADATNITITRATNSTFETSSNFNGTGAGRGYVTIQYTD